MRAWLGRLLCRLGRHDVRFIWTGEDHHDLESVCERCGYTRRLP